MKNKDTILHGLLSRNLQLIARNSPGAKSLRIYLHRLRGVKIGKGVWIGYDAIIETSYPFLVEIQDNAVIGIRNTIVAHFRGLKGVKIEEGAFLGPSVTVMPNVIIGKGSVVGAGSTVTSSVAPMTFVQGNPAKPIAKVGKVLSRDISYNQFLMSLRPLKK